MRVPLLISLDHPTQCTRHVHEARPGIPDLHTISRMPVQQLSTATEYECDSNDMHAAVGLCGKALCHIDKRTCCCCSASTTPMLLTEHGMWRPEPVCEYSVPAVGYRHRVQVETLGCYGYSTSGTLPNTSNPALRYWSASYVTMVPAKLSRHIRQQRNKDEQPQSWKWRESRPLQELKEQHTPALPSRRLHPSTTEAAITQLLRRHVKSILHST